MAGSNPVSKSVKMADIGLFCIKLIKVDDGQSYI